MRFNYEKLQITELALDLIVKIYQITKGWPREEMFGLVMQARRASYSILLNIAEGSGRGSKQDFARFIRQAIGSTLELDATLTI